MKFFVKHQNLLDEGRFVVADNPQEAISNYLEWSSDGLMKNASFVVGEVEQTASNVYQISNYKSFRVSTIVVAEEMKS